MVLIYERSGCLNDGLGRTVVLLQFEQLRVRIQFGKLEHIVKVGPSE